MAIATFNLPQWAHDLRGFLSNDDEATRHKAVSDLFGLPPFSAFPKSSVVRTWTLREWTEWATSVGFVPDDKTKHSYKFVEPKFGEIIFGIATTPGDICSSMRTAADLRNTVREKYQGYATFTVHAISYFVEHSVEAFADEAHFSTWLTELYKTSGGQRAVLRKVNIQDLPWCHPRELRRLMTVAQTEFGANVAEMLQRCGINPEIAERIKSMMKIVGDEFRVPQLLMGKLRDALDELRAEYKLEREEKQKARETAEVDRKAKQVELQKPSVLYKAEVDAVRRAILLRTETAVKAAENALNQLKNVHAQMGEIAFPTLPADFDKVADLTKYQDEAAKLKTEAEVIPKLKDRVSELELKAKSNPWRERCGELAEFVLTCVNDPNILKLAEHIPKLKAMARAELEDIKKSEKEKA